MRGLALLLVFGCLSPRIASAQANTSLTPEAVVRANIAATNAHDVDSILSTLGNRLQYRINRNERADTTFELEGEELRNTYERAVQLAPHAHFEILEQIVSGPFVVTREEVTGLQGGVSQVGLNVYRVENGRIVSLWILDVQNSRSDR